MIQPTLIPTCGNAQTIRAKLSALPPEQQLFEQVRSDHGDQAGGTVLTNPTAAHGAALRRRDPHRTLRVSPAVPARGVPRLTDVGVHAWGDQQREPARVCEGFLNRRPRFCRGADLLVRLKRR